MLTYQVCYPCITNLIRKDEAVILLDFDPIRYICGMNIEIKTVDTHAELIGIKALQTANLRKNISDEEATEQGFLMAEYSLEFLESMHAFSPSIIAKEGEKVVGYALVAVASIRDQHELMADLFDTADKILYDGRLIKDCPYVVVGQLCVGLGYRGLGLVDRMYNRFREELQDQFDYCITDVAQANPRSLKAHQRVGYKVIETLNYGGIGWDIVLWDWRN